MIDSELLYRRLPQDIQIYIGRFVPLWQRYGWHRPPIRKNSDKYYNSVRSVPHGICRHYKNYVVSYHYCRKRSLLQWELFLDYNQKQKEFWIIKISPQWKKTGDNGLIKRLFDSKFYEENIEEPSIAKRIRTSVSVMHHWRYPDTFVCRMEYSIDRQDGLPTRQTCVSVLCNHMIESAYAADEFARKK